MISRTDIALRIILAAQLIAMALVRAYFGAPGSNETGDATQRPRSESAWLTATLAMIALVHFGAIITYLAEPSLLQWSAFEAGEPLRWIGIVISTLGVVGEIWAAVSLGASYSPMLRVAGKGGVVTAGPYRWIRHPLYAFWLPVMAGWGLAARNWFIVASGAVLIFVLGVIRVPREEAMMLQSFGQSYRDYMARTGRFTPRLRTVRTR